MGESEIYEIEIELEKTKDGWRGISHVPGNAFGFYTAEETATEVLDSLMVELKDNFGGVLDGKVEVDKESGKSNLKGKNYEALIKREAISFKE